MDYIAGTQDVFRTYINFSLLKLNSLPNRAFCRGDFFRMIAPHLLSNRLKHWQTAGDCSFGEIMNRQAR
jgi:hypothetical protein